MECAMKSYERDVLERLKELLELREEIHGEEMVHHSRDLYEHIIATLNAEENALNDLRGRPLESDDEP
jgi:hypothetical protein